MVQLEAKHGKYVESQKAEHRKELERQRAEQLSIREELRKELAQVQMEKFSAMATELTHAHMVRKRKMGKLTLSFLTLFSSVVAYCIVRLLSSFYCISFLHVLFSQVELSAQKEALDDEHCKALETLKNQVTIRSSLAGESITIYHSIFYPTPILLEQLHVLLYT